MKLANLFLVGALLSAGLAVYAENEQSMIGVLESRPENVEGVWVVDGKQITVDKETRINGLGARAKKDDCLKISVVPQGKDSFLALSVSEMPVKTVHECREAAQTLKDE